MVNYIQTRYQFFFHVTNFVKIKKEFSALYDLKIMIFLEEVLSVLTTPFILWFSLPKCSERIVDFVREFTVHVDGMGYVCSFAVFDFKRHGKVHFLGSCLFAQYI